MAYYTEKNYNGGDYVEAANAFYMKTLQQATKLPQRWYEPIVRPVVENAEKVRNNVAKANKVYINEKDQTIEQTKQAVNERDKYIYEALRDLSAFDMAFDVLMSFLDVRKNQKNYMKDIIMKMLKDIKKQDPELKDLNIKLTYKENEIGFSSIVGYRPMQLNITSNNIKHWLSLEEKLESLLKEKISKDKQYVKSLENKGKNQKQELEEKEDLKEDIKEKVNIKS